MSEFEDRVNSILSDPAQMDKIANLAKSLMGEAEDSKQDKGGGFDLSGLSGLAGSILGTEQEIDGQLLGKISKLMLGSSQKDRQEHALLEAMKPYLSQKRRDKVDRAMKLAKLARIARLAMGEMGDEDV